MQIYFAHLLITLNVPSDRQMYPWGYMYPRLGTPDLEQVTSLSVWLDVRRTPRVKDPGNEEAENYWHLNTEKLVLTSKQVSKN